MKLRIKNADLTAYYMNVVSVPFFGQLPDKTWLPRLKIPCPSCCQVDEKTAIEALTSLTVAAINGDKLLTVEIKRNAWTCRCVEVSELYYQGRCQCGFEVKILTELIIGSLDSQLSSEPLSLHS